MAKRTPRRRTRGRTRKSRSVAAPTPPLAAALRNVSATLTELDRGYALVGGLAVSARVEPRMTRDVDLAIDTIDDADAESLVRELVGRGYHVTSTVEQTHTDQLATVRLTPPGKTSLVVDLLFASCGIESEIVKAAELLEILPELVIPVATAPHLIAMKVLARDDRERPQDLDDLLKLRALLEARERSAVVSALELITKRGFNRRRDLIASWNEIAQVKKRATKFSATSRR
jgi:hypothetical protein